MLFMFKCSVPTDTPLFCYTFQYLPSASIDQGYGYTFIFMGTVNQEQIYR